MSNTNQQPVSSAVQGIPSVTARSFRADRLKGVGRMLALIFLAAGVVLGGYYALHPKDADASQSADPEHKHLRAEDITSTKKLKKLPLFSAGDQAEAGETKDQQEQQEAEPQPEVKEPKSAAVSNPPSEDTAAPPAGAQGKAESYPGLNELLPPVLPPLNMPEVSTGSGEEALSLEDRKFMAPMMGRVENASSQQSSDLAAMQAATAAGLQLAKASGNSQGALAARLQPVLTENGAVRTLSHPSLTLNKGTLIDCILETRVDTSVPGMTSCLIPRDLYSSDGRVLLIEKGTRAVGEYQGSVQQGLERIFLLWTELRTPHGVVASLNSPAADALGGAGFDGQVNHHWFKRFGNALLFSMVSDGFSYALSSAQSHNSDSNVTYNNSERGVGEIIKAAMEQSGQIPPTLIKNQGERVSIMVARDVDFSEVYALRVQNGRVQRTQGGK